MHQKWVQIIPNEPGNQFEVLPNQFSYKTLRKRVFASKPKTPLRIIESTPKTHRSTPNESKAHETANEPKQRALRNETTRQTVSTNALDCEHFRVLSSLLIRLRSSVSMTQTFVPAYSRIIRGFLVFVRTPVSPPIRWHRVSPLGP